MCNTADGAIKYYKSDRYTYGYKIFTEQLVNQRAPKLGIMSTSNHQILTYVTDKDGFIRWRNLLSQGKGRIGFCAFNKLEEAQKVLRKWIINSYCKYDYVIHRIRCRRILEKNEDGIFNDGSVYKTILVDSFKILERKVTYRKTPDRTWEV